METVLFKSEEKKDVHTAADFLRQLADKIDQQRLVLKYGLNEIQLNIPAAVVLELKVEEKVKPTQTKRSFEIELEWIEGDDPTAGTVVLG